MLKGKSFADLGAELDRVMQGRQDRIADTRAIRVQVAQPQPVQQPVAQLAGNITSIADRAALNQPAVPQPAAVVGTGQELAVVEAPVTGPSLTIAGAETFGIKPLAHSQIAERLGIPSRYYNRMLDERPDLWERSVNTWLDEDMTGPKEGRVQARRLVRTLDGNVRAFLSAGYRMIDNEDIFRHSVEVLGRMAENQTIDPGLEIRSMDLTDTRLYIHVALAKRQTAVKVGDIVRAGFVIRNSEVGCGAVHIDPWAERLACLNGMISKGNIPGMPSFRQVHAGRQAEADEHYRVIQDDTRKALDEALMLQMRDTIHALAAPGAFDPLWERLQAAAGTTQVRNPMRAVEALAKVTKAPLVGSEIERLAENLIRDQDYTKWGMLNAVTRLAHDQGADQYDRAVQFEELGGQVLDLSRSQWEQIAEAA